MRPLDSSLLRSLPLSIQLFSRSSLSLHIALLQPFSASLSAPLRRIDEAFLWILSRTQLNRSSVLRSTLSSPNRTIGAAGFSLIPGRQYSGQAQMERGKENGGGQELELLIKSDFGKCPELNSFALNGLPVIAANPRREFTGSISLDETPMTLRRFQRSKCSAERGGLH